MFELAGFGNTIIFSGFSAKTSEFELCALPIKDPVSNRIRKEYFMRSKFPMYPQRLNSFSGISFRYV